jgi:hypothetical protein
MPQGLDNADVSTVVSNLVVVRTPAPLVCPGKAGLYAVFGFSVSTGGYVGSFDPSLSLEHACNASVALAVSINSRAFIFKTMYCDRIGYASSGLRSRNVYYIVA